MSYKYVLYSVLVFKISVVRMIMRDTIEHELYLRNNSEETAQVDFDFDKSGKFGLSERSNGVGVTNTIVLARRAKSSSKAS